MRRTPTLAALLLLAGALTACARRHAVPPGAAQPPQASESAGADQVGTEMDGVIVASGTEHAAITTLQREAHAPVRLVGSLEGELRRLSGATVRVQGVSGTGFPGGTLDARRYEVLAIEGQRPYVGVLLVRGDSSWLVAADTLRLAAVPDQLRAQAGARVWVIGPATPDGREVRVQAYGVIDPARR